MQLIRWLIALACIAVGAVVGALNRQSILIDFGAFQLATTLGIALLASLLLGVLLGGLAISASLVPLRRRLARAERERAPPPATPGL